MGIQPFSQLFSHNSGRVGRGESRSISHNLHCERHTTQSTILPASQASCRKSSLPKIVANSLSTERTHLFSSHSGIRSSDRTVVTFECSKQVVYQRTFRLIENLNLRSQSMRRGSPAIIECANRFGCKRCLMSAWWAQFNVNIKLERQANINRELPKPGFQMRQFNCLAEHNRTQSDRIVRHKRPDAPAARRQRENNFWPFRVLLIQIVCYKSHQFSLSSSNCFWLFFLGSPVSS